MHFGRTKIFIIFFLVALAIYQTSNLWFENFSNHSFFYSLKSKINKETYKSKVEYNLKSIIINLGNNKFIQKFNDIDTSDYKQVFDEAIFTVLKKSSSVQKQSINIDDVLYNKSVIYNYSYTINGQEIPTIFNSNTKNALKIERFDSIAILPSTSKLENVSVIFFDTKNKLQYVLSVNNYDNNLLNLINQFNSEDNSSYYLSSVKSGFDLFEKNQFILTWNKDDFKYNKLNLLNPVEKDGVFDIKYLENYINIFFENPAAKWYLDSEDYVTYSDESTVVKYYKDGFLEYSNYKIGNKQNSNKIFELYSIAINFLNQDSNIKNEYYLKKYVKEQDKVTFYFDYKINNLPINITKINDENSIESMIEVTVYQNKVSKYKRIIYDFCNDEEVSFFNKDFLTTIDNLIYKNYNSGEYYKIKNIELAYNFEDIDKKLNKISIGWFVEIDNKIFFED